MSIRSARHASTMRRLLGCCERNLQLLATVIALAACPLPAAAAIVDHGTYVSDTVNGADWLKFAATLGMSFDQAVAAHPGWSVASVDQVHALWAQYGYVGDTPGPGVNANADLTDRVAANLGYTFDFGTPSQINRGLSGIVATSAMGAAYRDIAILQVMKPLSGAGTLLNDGAFTVSSFLFVSSFSDPRDGVYMTRASLPVPEPSGFAMFIAGVLLLSVAVRKPARS